MPLYSIYDSIIYILYIYDSIYAFIFDAFFRNKGDLQSLFWCTVANAALPERISYYKDYLVVSLYILVTGITDKNYVILY